MRTLRTINKKTDNLNCGGIMKLKLDIEKKNKGNIGQCEGHNERHHPTQSQLPKEAWFTNEGFHVIVPFNKALLKQAKDLSVRRDSVFAIEINVQVGNQTDWRAMPDAENPCGKKLPGASGRLKALVKGAKAAAEAEFGKGRIVSMVLHTDESTPHVHILFVPIVDNKLNQKKWVNGHAACGALRARLHSHINEHLPCTYEKGVPKGGRHDPSKAAGAINGPKPKKGILEKASDALSKSGEIKALKAMISGLNQQLQTMFSRLKRAEKVAKDEAERREKAEKKAAESDLAERKARREIVVLERKLNALAPKIEPVKPAPAPSDGLLPAQKPGKAARPT